MPNRSVKRPKLSSAFLLGAAAAFLLASLVLFLPVQKKIQEVEIAAQADITGHAARSLQLAVSTVLQREWGSLVGFSSFVDSSSYGITRAFTDAAVVASEAVGWAGIADLSGRIIVGSGGTHEGEDVSASAWFQQGLRGEKMSVPIPGATDATDALNDAIVHMSRPLRNAEGMVTGVAVYAVRLSWLTSYIAEAADRLDVDVALLDEAGQIVFAHGVRVPGAIPTEVKTHAALGSAFAGYAANGQSRGSIAAVVPELVAGDMPELRLALVVRVPAGGVASSLSTAASTMIWIVVGLFTIIGVIAVVFSVGFLKPISDLAEAAASIAEGRSVYPSDVRSSREAMLLSNALVRLRASSD